MIDKIASGNIVAIVFGVIAIIIVAKIAGKILKVVLFIVIILGLIGFLYTRGWLSFLGI